ncbi:DUF3592 domain-containing protein [Saprospira sp. CCB-QB6]|uniref:DUF3592 domain-containing protein n=1 Tax=Saprospira sp. CCB-QB6 TaxID=3023936 RepID=UPI0023499A8C|nr:DUF3592 domain-containing protein [Saprospira sp. CCB-QB6]WCL80488.1 DUF3592 domain-containing protein [Saprospira sp. CCB-QB6]
MATFSTDLAKRLIFWLLLLFPSYLLTLELKEVYKVIDFQDNGLLVDAQVIAVKDHSRTNNGDLAIMYSVTFMYKSPEGEVFRRRIDSLPVYYYEGQSVELIYERGKPELAVPNDFGLLYEETITSIFTIFGISFLVGLFFYVAFLKTS